MLMLLNYHARLSIKPVIETKGMAEERVVEAQVMLEQFNGYMQDIKDALERGNDERP